ncbi:MAG: hypothetical protein MZV63_07280 [Marinilabiliales bacterium]|nr:hypothetical protein [Marinilabiliales bacterium]
MLSLFERSLERKVLGARPRPVELVPGVQGLFLHHIQRAKRFAREFKARQAGCGDEFSVRDGAFVPIHLFAAIAGRHRLEVARVVARVTTRVQEPGTGQGEGGAADGRHGYPRLQEGRGELGYPLVAARIGSTSRRREGRGGRRPPRGPRRGSGRL